VNIIPCGHRLLVKPDTVDEVTKKEIAAFDSLKSKGFEISGRDKKQERQAVDTGIVVSIGPTAWKKDELGFEPWCQVGNKIHYARYAGMSIRNPNNLEEEYVMLNDEDVVAVIE
jgi:co-chaperonin GroES (HSP10)